MTIGGMFTRIADVRSSKSNQDLTQPSATKSIKRFGRLAAVLGLIVWTIGRTEASPVFYIDDRLPAGPITVTEKDSTTGTITPVALLADSTLDFAHFRFTIENGYVPPSLLVTALISSMSATYSVIGYLLASRRILESSMFSSIREFQ